MPKREIDSYIYIVLSVCDIIEPNLGNVLLKQFLTYIYWAMSHSNNSQDIDKGVRMFFLRFWSIDGFTNRSDKNPNTNGGKTKVTRLSTPGWRSSWCFEVFILSLTWFCQHIHLRKIVAQGGILGLWRGCWPNVQVVDNIILLLLLLLTTILFPFKSCYCRGQPWWILVTSQHTTGDQKNNKTKHKNTTLNSRDCARFISVVEITISHATTYYDFVYF